jgi:hypothetical protein
MNSCKTITLLRVVTGMKFVDRHNIIPVTVCEGFEVLSSVVMKSTFFWDITPCDPLGVNQRFVGTYRLHLQGQKNKLSKKPWFLAGGLFCFPHVFTRVSCSAYFFTLKMEAIYSSKRSADTQRTTPRYIPEEGTLYYCMCSLHGSKSNW